MGSWADDMETYEDRIARQESTIRKLTECLGVAKESFEKIRVRGQMYEDWPKAKLASAESEDVLAKIKALENEMGGEKLA
jgi:uncharacterized coiled-coil protein SlyX